MNTEDSVCPFCGEPYDEEGYCPEDREGMLEQGREWAKEYLPAGWHQYDWEIVKQEYGRFRGHGKVLDLYAVACIGQHPDGWYGVIVCDTDDRVETDIFNFYPPDEQPIAGPFATRPQADETIMRWFALLVDQLEPIDLIERA